MIFYGWEELLEKEMATHSGILAWETPWKPCPKVYPRKKRSVTYLCFSQPQNSEYLPWAPIPTPRQLLPRNWYLGSPKPSVCPEPSFTFLLFLQLSRPGKQLK